MCNTLWSLVAVLAHCLAWCGMVQLKVSLHHCLADYFAGKIAWYLTCTLFLVLQCEGQMPGPQLLRCHQSCGSIRQALLACYDCRVLPSSGSVVNSCRLSS